MSKSIYICSISPLTAVEQQSFQGVVKEENIDTDRFCYTVEKIDAVSAWEKEIGYRFCIEYEALDIYAAYAIYGKHATSIRFRPQFFKESIYGTFSFEDGTEKDITNKEIDKYRVRKQANAYAYHSTQLGELDSWELDVSGYTDRILDAEQILALAESYCESLKTREYYVSSNTPVLNILMPAYFLAKNQGARLLITLG